MRHNKNCSEKINCNGMCVLQLVKMKAKCLFNFKQTIRPGFSALGVVYHIVLYAESKGRVMLCPFQIKDI